MLHRAALFPPIWFLLSFVRESPIGQLALLITVRKTALNHPSTWEMGPLFLFQFSASKKHKVIKDFSLEVNIRASVCGGLFNHPFLSRLCRDFYTVTDFNSVITFILPRHVDKEMAVMLPRY